MKKIIALFVFVIFVFALIYPICTFKEDIEDVEVNLLGMKLVIDAGHGGIDPGTYSENIFEKNINLEISKKIGNLFIESESQVYFTRTDDYDLSKEDSYNHKMEDLKNRARLINYINPNLVISLHLNAILDSSVFGPMVYYRNNDEISKRYAISIQNSLNKFTGLKKIIHPERYYLFMKTTAPIVLIECGFLSNQYEREKLCDSVYQDNISQAIYDGVTSLKV